MRRDAAGGRGGPGRSGPHASRDAGAHTVRGRLPAFALIAAVLLPHIGHQALPGSAFASAASAGPTRRRGTPPRWW
ncbi:MAG TPA: hypothetical protein VE546_10100 [Streptomyces sp.]|uniref:hypothetical protein n=1 Tax=Streptomyces sp. TaxID=1931 RepID=UPI002D54A911|nr:hypothetical protein [Streptomyces sp.]HZG03912.1 hypothetical protein [Streptomyces sp.]